MAEHHCGICKGNHLTSNHRMRDCGKHSWSEPVGGVQFCTKTECDAVRGVNRGAR